MKKIVDLNSDIGEGFGDYRLGMDEEIIKYVSSVNIACGYHGGDPLIMEATILEGKKRGTGLGAHPAYPDLMGFGRRDMNISPREARAYMIYQVGALSAFAKANQVQIQHLKFHGAFYNRASHDPDMAREVIRGILDIDKDMILLALSGSYLARLAQDMGLRVGQEVFADRAYNDDASLVDRRLPGAFIENEEEASNRIIGMLLEGKVTSISGKKIPIVADSICVHGDNPKAIAFVKHIRERLIRENIEIKNLGEFL